MKTAGIEVSCQTLTLVINQNGRLGEPRTLGNTPDRYPELIQVLRKARVSRVCFKAMGLYHLDPALVLDGAGLEVMVIDPKAAKGFAETMQTRTETAVVDATVLAELALRIPFEPWSRPDASALAVRACAHRITTLNEACTQTKDELHAARKTAATPEFLLAQLQQSIAQFDAQIQRLH